MGLTSFNERMAHILLSVGGPRLSEKTGISRAQLHRLKEAGRDTTRENLIKISQATGVELQWLCTGEGRMYIGAEEENPGYARVPEFDPASRFTDDELEMIELFRKAPLAAKAKVLQILVDG